MEWFIKAEASTAGRSCLQIGAPGRCLTDKRSLIKVSSLSLKWLAYLAKWGFRIKPKGNTLVYPYVSKRQGEMTPERMTPSWEGLEASLLLLWQRMHNSKQSKRSMIRGGVSSKPGETNSPFHIVYHDFRSGSANSHPYQILHCYLENTKTASRTTK